jgi:hypothetical protein
MRSWAGEPLGQVLRILAGHHSPIAVTSIYRARGFRGLACPIYVRNKGRRPPCLAGTVPLVQQEAQQQSSGVDSTPTDHPVRCKVRSYCMPYSSARGLLLALHVPYLPLVQAEALLRMNPNCSLIRAFSAAPGCSRSTRSMLPLRVSHSQVEFFMRAFVPVHG